MLTPIATPSIARSFLVYDLEWVPKTLAVRMVGCYDGQRFRWYKTIEDFLSAEMNPQNSGKWFYAHAGGLYDVQFVLESVIANKSYSAEVGFSGSSAVNVRLKKGRHCWQFLDSYWLLRKSLADIAKSIGMEKTGPELGVDRADWYANTDIKTLVPYCENDCVILWNAIWQFENVLLELGGQLESTLAATAMGLFRRKYLQQELRTSTAINEMARKAYTASRVEVFREQSNGDAYYYDINSSFPYAMTFPCPGEFVGNRQRLTDSLMRKCSDEPFFVDVTITVPETYLPPLPIRGVQRVLFPFGRWRAVYSSIDIQLALETGCRIEKVHDIWLFKPFHALRDYALDLYERRKNAKTPVEKEVLKLTLNQLYGKFAQKRERQQIFVNPSPDFLRTVTRENMLLPGVWSKSFEKMVPHEHVPIAATVTARARKTLFDFLIKSREYHYCDTDGFSTVDEYPVSNELGGLKLEKRTKSGKFYAPKVYELQGDVLSGGEWKAVSIQKAKGFSLRDNPDAFGKLVAGEPVSVERMSRFKENLREGRTNPVERDVTKQLRNAMTKRFHLGDGNTRPWHYDEIKAFLK